MGLPQIIARNQIQKTNKRTVSRADTSGYPITYYTCPTGKIAVIKGSWICDDTGAAAVVDLNSAGISIAEVQATGGVITLTTPQNLAEDVLYPFEADLVAGETLTCTQDSGTNATTKLFIVIEEFNI